MLRAVKPQRSTHRNNESAFHKREALQSAHGGLIAGILEAPKRKY